MSRILSGLAIAAVYFGAGRMGLALASIHPSASAVWPPSGIALAAALLMGRSAWPFIFAGAFLVNVTTGVSALASLGIATGNTLEAVAGAWFMRRLAGGIRAFERPGGVLWFTVVTAGLSTAIGASIGVSSLFLGGFIPSDRSLLPIWVTWWLGDAMGDIIVAPFLILWANRTPQQWSLPKILEADMLLLSVFALGNIVFSKLAGLTAQTYPAEFVLIPLVIWSAFRFSQRETATVAFLLSAVALWGTLHGGGPFAALTQNESLVLLQSYTGVVCLLGLAVGATVSERRRAEGDLSRMNAGLEAGVRERTGELSRVNARLVAEITERERTEESLRKSEERWRSLVENAPDIIIMYDREGRILFINRTVPGLSPEAVIGTSGYDYVPADQVDILRQNLKRVFEEGASVSYEIQGLGPNNTLAWYASHLGPVRRFGQVTAAILITRDITALKQAEETKRMAEELERHNSELQDFASVVSHDLQHPLRNLRIFGTRLRRRPKAAFGPEERTYLDRMLETVTWMQTLIKDLLAHSQIPGRTKTFEPLDLSQVALEVASDFEMQIQQTRTTFEIGPLPTLEADPIQMRQLFQNLIGNSLKFRRAGVPPHILVTAAPLYNTEPANVLATPDYWEITVKDNGMGFDPEASERIFLALEKLHSREAYPGTGLGLAICKRIVRHHGGRIAASSSPGNGASFVITLPARATTSIAA